MKEEMLHKEADILRATSSLSRLQSKQVSVLEGANEELQEALKASLSRERRARGGFDEGVEEKAGSVEARELDSLSLSIVQQQDGVRVAVEAEADLRLGVWLEFRGQVQERYQV